jgi:hypothetical protein
MSGVGWLTSGMEEEEAGFCSPPAGAGASVRQGVGHGQGQSEQELDLLNVRDHHDGLLHPVLQTQLLPLQGQSLPQPPLEGQLGQGWQQLGLLPNIRDHIEGLLQPLSQALAGQGWQLEQSA